MYHAKRKCLLHVLTRSSVIEKYQCSGISGHANIGINKLISGAMKILEQSHYYVTSVYDTCTDPAIFSQAVDVGATVYAR